MPMNAVESSLQSNFYQLNGVVGLFMIIAFSLLLYSLIMHMKEMVRLKYHVDKRAEFDESRVKIVIASIAVLLFAYFGVWAYSLTNLNLSKTDDFQLSLALFKATNLSMLVGVYVVFFINNRIKTDIDHIRKVTPATSSELDVII